MSPVTEKGLTGPILEEEVQLSLGDLSRACCVEADFIVELVHEGVLDPIEPTRTRWTFTGVSLLRLRKAVNLHRDLGLNLAGVALVLELLEETEQLRSRLRQLEALGLRREP